MAWQDTARKLNEYNEKTVNELFGDFKDISNEIFKEVEKILDRLTVKDGKFTPTKKDLETIASLRDRIIKILKRSDYSDRVKEFTKRFDKVIGFNAQIQEELNDIKPKTFLKNDPIVQATKKNLGQGLDIPFIQGSVVDPVSNIIIQSVLAGGLLSALRTTVRRQIKGSKGTVNILKREVGTQAFDVVHQANGVVNNEIAKEYKLKNVAYIGDIIQTTRPQCKRWVGMGVILASELQKEINWAYNNGSGMIPNTTPANFKIVTGGYNCRHDGVPTNRTEI